MAKNYAALARSVIAALGGVDNISAVTHCMTRLRFVIKDDALIDSPTLKTIPGVLGVVRSDNQCQVIIGNTVSQAFQEVVSLLPGDMQPAQPVGKPKLTLRRIGAGILDALIGTMSPLIPAIIGGSMVKLLAMILEMSGVLTKGSPTLTILNVIGDGAFFFLPLMVAASAAIKFKTNMSLAIAIAGVLVHPSFIELMAKAAQGEHCRICPDSGHRGEIYLHGDPGAGDDLVPVIYRTLGGQHYTGGDQKLPQTNADCVDCRTAGNPADWPDWYLDR